jgi:hypothetical protein
MPEISRFYGIIIGIFYSDHAPPRFHVRYGEHKAAVSIKNLTVLEGSLPPRALGMVIEWAALHQGELLTNWDLAVNNQLLQKIDPLP